MINGLPKRVIAKRACIKYSLSLAISLLLPLTHINAQTAASNADISQSQRCNPGYRSDLVNENLKGKVKTTINEIYGPRIADVEKKALLYDSTVTSHYDKKGNLTEQRSDSLGGKVFFITKRKYTDKGLIESETSNGADSAYYEIKYRYNASGLRQYGEIISRMAGTKTLISALRYNDLGQWIELDNPNLKKCISYDLYGNRILISDSTLTGEKTVVKDSFIYDKDCRLIASRGVDDISIRHMFTTTNGETKSSTDTIRKAGKKLDFKYDDMGNVKEKEIREYREPSPQEKAAGYWKRVALFEQYNYKYDSHGNWVEKTTYATDGRRKYLERRQIIYY